MQSEKMTDWPWEDKFLPSYPVKQYKGRLAIAVCRLLRWRNVTWFHDDKYGDIVNSFVIILGLPKAYLERLVVDLVTLEFPKGMRFYYDHPQLTIEDKLFEDSLIYDNFK